MATDLAQIGFAVDTKQLERGIQALTSFGEASHGANSAFKVFAGAVAGFSKAVYAFVAATKTATSEEVAAAKQAMTFSDKVYSLSKAQTSLTKATNGVTKAVKNQVLEFATAKKQLDSISSDMMTRINAITGVTGLTGKSAKDSYYSFRDLYGKDFMNQVRLQPENNIPRDMMPNRFNTANLAAQFQDIAVTASMGMNPLLVAVQQGTQLSAVLNSMEHGLKGLKEAFKMIINPTSLWAIAVTALVVTLIQAVDWSGVAEVALGALSDVFTYISEHAELATTSVLALAAAFVVLKGGAIASALASVVSGIMTIGSAIATAAVALVSFLGLPVTIGIGAIAALVAVYNAFKEDIDNFFGTDIGEFAKTAVNKMIGMFTAAFFQIVAAAEWIWQKLKSLVTDEKAPEKGYFETIEEARKKAFRIDYLGGLAEGVKKGASAAAGALSDLKNKLSGTVDEADKLAESWKNLTKEINQSIADLEFEGELIGLGTYERTYRTVKRSMIQKAKEGGINVNDIDPATGQTYISFIENASRATAHMTENNEKLSDSYKTARSITGSFFEDLRRGLFEGANAWEAFGDAATNVLDKILSKMLDVGVDALFNYLGVEGWFSSSSKNLPTTSGGNVKIMSKPTSLLTQAKGGVFSNGVYDSPTFFKFAKGGKFGVMGEAGPEAVMPLKRGPDGSLGVRADGIGGSNVVVNVYNNSDTQTKVEKRQTSQGTEIDVMIDQLVAEKMSQPGTSSNNALTAFSKRALITR